MLTYEQRLHSSPNAVIREAGLYFMQQGDLYKTLQNLTQRLDEASIQFQ